MESLPDELLVKILNLIPFSDYNHRPQALCAAALTNRRLARIAGESMWQYVNFLGWRHSQSHRLRIQKFNRSCLENEGLVHRVKGVHLEWEDTGNEELRQDMDTCNEFFSHLSRSRSLIHLTVQMDDVAHLQRFSSILDYAPGTFTSLTELGIGLWHRPLRTEVFLRLLELPKLEKVFFGAILPGPSEDFQSEGASSRPASNSLQNLLIADEVHPETLRLAVAKCSKLKTLSSKLPGGQPYGDRGEIFLTDKLGTRLCDLAETLKPLAEHLVDLTVTASDFRLYGDDESVCDLSAMLNIQRLSVCSWVLFGLASTANECPWTDRISRLMPRKLKTLEVQYEGQAGVFYALRDAARPARDHFLVGARMPAAGEPPTFGDYWPQSRSSAAAAGLSWVGQLAESKQLGRLAYLQSVSLEEAKSEYPSVRWNIRPWTGLRDNAVAEYCRTAKVDLSVKLRCPEGWLPPLGGSVDGHS